MVKEFNQESFDDDVLKSGKSSVIDFYTPTCGPCRKLAPTIKKLSEEFEGVQIGKCDVSENFELAAAYKISAVPTIISFKDGKEFERHIGVLSEDNLRNMIERVG